MLGNFDIVVDPRQEQQILAGQLKDRAGNESQYDIWTHFSTRSIRTGAGKPLEDGFKVRHFRIDASILGMSGDISGTQGLKLTASTEATIHLGKRIR